jgi:hypothetical protein
MTLGAGALTMLVDWSRGEGEVIAGACAVLGGIYLMRRELRHSGFHFSSR